MEFVRAFMALLRPDRSHNLCLLELLLQQIGKLWKPQGKQEVRGRSVGRTRSTIGAGVSEHCDCPLDCSQVRLRVYTYLSYLCLSETVV